jgi:hypothetical protein
MESSIIVVTYPPDFDGELHITCTKNEPKIGGRSYTYTFTHAACSGGSDDSIFTLEHAATAILRMISQRRAAEYLRSLDDAISVRRSGKTALPVGD